MTGTGEADNAAIREALTSRGLTIEEPVADPNAAESDASPNSSEQPARPGEETPAAAGGESGSASEAGEKATQEPSQAAGEEGKKPSRGNFKSKIEKAEARIERLTEDLEAERGSKTKLQQQLAEAQAELEKLKKPATEEPVKAETGPVKPKRPTMADFDFDEEKFNAALTKYEDEDLPAYYQAVADKRVDDRLREEQERQQQAEAKRADEAALQAHFGRVNQGRGAYEDWDDVFGSIADDAIALEGIPGDVVESYIKTCDNPADLLYFFAKEAADNGESAELQRIGSLHPVAMVRELTKLEDRLAKERESRTKKPAATAKPPAAQNTPEKPAPVRPKTQPPTEPIETVGSGRAANPTDTLAAAAARGDTRAFRKLREAGVQF